MSTPEMIGRIRYTEPRAVYVREGDNVEDIHSAVHGSIAVYTDNYAQAQKLLAAWVQLVTAFNAKVDEILLEG